MILAMPKYAKRTDEGQQSVIRMLRRIPGVTVVTGHDDYLVGYRGRTYWVEHKREDMRKRDGNLRAGAKTDSQRRLDVEWTGHRIYATSLQDVLDGIGFNKR